MQNICKTFCYLSGIKIERETYTQTQPPREVFENPLHHTTLHHKKVGSTNLKFHKSVFFLSDSDMFGMI